MTCPSVDELLAGDGTHARECAACRAVLAARHAPLTCALAEALLAARAAGAIAPDSELLLGAHLDHCDDCARVARELEAPIMTDALASAVELERNFDELTVVAPDNYVRGVEIGRGGMGHIVRARDRRLGRVVAIKQLIDERMRARFEHEARLTARLQHPAIVTIYEAGRWPSGEPFYAMKYVAGRPLDLVIADLPTLDERLTLLPNLTIVVEAIAYAHGEGVVHRDLKPQNILIGPFGESVVIDWGLAKDLTSAADPGAPFRGEPGWMTQGGAGTPAYMAPEQARGESPNQRVDVYALGATLHHVLSGARPDERTLPAETPPDLRAIVAKAMATEPADRYPTAAELAGELKRFQNGQLVAAHRYTTRELVRRWIRRHRAVLIVATIALIVLAISSTFGVRRIIAERDRANQQKQVAETQRKGAERLVDYMLGTMRDRLEPIGKVDLLAGVGKQVEGYFASVPAADETDVEVLRQRARGLLLLARVDHQKANLADAKVEYERALKLCMRRDQLVPTSDSAACIAQVLLGLGQVERDLGATAAFAERLRQECDVVDRALARDPTNVALRRIRAGTAYLQGHEHLHLGLLASAREALLVGVPIAEGLVTEDPRDTESLNVLGALMDALCHVDTVDGRPESARPHCARQSEIYDRLRAIEPDTFIWKINWARTAAETADVENQLGDWRPARARLALALDALRRGAHDDPANLLTLEHLARVGLSACENQLAASDPRPDDRTCIEAVNAHETVLHKHLDNDGVAITLSSTESSLSAVAVLRHDLALARTAATQAVKLAEAGADAHPDDPTWPELLSMAQWRLAAVIRAEGHAADARAAATSAVATIERLGAKPDNFVVELTFLHADLLLLDLVAEADDHTVAEPQLRRLLERIERAVTRWPQVVEIQEQLAFVNVRLAEITTDPAQARSLRERALRLISPLEQRDAIGAEFAGLPERARRASPR